MHTITAPDGTTIAYDRTGTGEPLVLIGGVFSYRRFPGQVKLAQLLSARFTVYSYDRRGRGDSGDTAPYSIEREIEDLAAVIDAAGAPPACGACPPARSWPWTRGRCGPAHPQACRAGAAARGRPG